MAEDDVTPEEPGEPGTPDALVPTERVVQLDIQDEMRQSYLTYAMSVIVSRALPDVRDGLKPSQRRILVAMNDLNLGPSSGRVKCAKISGDTSGNYHPHGESSVYPTLVRLAQNWVMRQTLIDKQGNFGSLAGLPPAAMRYTEARLSAVAAEMLEDIDRNTVDYVPTYDQSRTEPVVLPSKFPNLVVNGSTGIAVGMATSIPPHNLAEVCDAVVKVLDDPDCTADDILEVLPGPDFPTGGVICGRYAIRQGYLTGQANITLRAKTHFEEERKSTTIVVTEIPYMKTRDDVKAKLEALAVGKEPRVPGIAEITDYTDRKIPDWQVRLHIRLKKDADPDVVLNQLYKYSPLQDTVRFYPLALVGNRPQLLSMKGLLEEFVRHRVDVIRRRTEFLLAEARKRKHTVEGLLVAQDRIDEIISTIRSSPSRAEARVRLQEIAIPARMIERALGADGYTEYVRENGEREEYSLSANQADAIVSMQLGSLANLERENLQGEHAGLLKNIAEYLDLLGDEANIRAVVREDMLELKRKYPDARRTEISDEELGDVNIEDLIAEEPMVVTLTQRGWVKRTQLSVYQAQNRGGKGIAGAKVDEDNLIEHLFVASTHAWLLFFSDQGKVYWKKVFDLPLKNRTARGNALVNMLRLDEGERIQGCVAVRDFEGDDRYLVVATKNGVVKKTDLAAYSRPMKGGIIAMKLDEDDRLIDVRVVAPGEDVILETAGGMAIRFNEADARSMGRNTRGVKGISLSKDDEVVGMVTGVPTAYLFTVTENGYGKRTPIGLGDLDDAEETDDTAETNGDESGSTASGARYRRQKRGGKGLIDIKTTERNGRVIGILSVDEGDEILMMTAAGKIQRIRAADVGVIGRNTQGVRVIRLDEDDTLVSIARIPAEVVDESAALEESVTDAEAPTDASPGETPSDETPTDGE